MVMSGFSRAEYIAPFSPLGGSAIRPDPLSVACTQQREGKGEKRNFLRDKCGFSRAEEESCIHEKKKKKNSCMNFSDRFCCWASRHYRSLEDPDI